MKVEPNTVVKLDYVLRVDGEVADSTPEGETITVLQGHAHTLPPGLDAALPGLPPGPFELELPPEKAQGTRDLQKVLVVERGDFPPGADIEVGEEFYTETADGSPVAARISAVDGDRVTVDLNPPYAGKTLRYTGTIHAVRSATPEELDHGHVHGEGGVEH